MSRRPLFAAPPPPPRPPPPPCAAGAGCAFGLVGSTGAGVGVAWTPRFRLRSLSFVSALPVASQISSIDPKLLVGTMYENGLVMRVTRAYLPSGDRLKLVIMPGVPNLVIAPVARSTMPIWPVACHSSNWNSYGVRIKLAYVRNRLRSLSMPSRISGPDGTAGACGRGVRPSGGNTAARLLPLLISMNVVTKFASIGTLVLCRGLFVARSVTHTCVDSSPSVMYMTPVPSSVQRELVTRMLAGVAIVLRDPSAAEITWMPIVLRRVSARWRFAL